MIDFLKFAVAAVDVVPHPGETLWLPAVGSEFASKVDNLYWFIWYLSLFFFVAIMAGTAYLVFKYRLRENARRKTSPIAGNAKLEVIWIAIPTLLLGVIFFWGFYTWMDYNVPPANAMEVRVTGQKWLWYYDYPRDNVTGASELVVPVNKNVRLIMSSKDVLHSYFIPAFRIKKDIIPNRYTVIWFKADRIGEYYATCAEYCGTDHSRMMSKVKVVSQEDYQKWVDAGGESEGGEGLTMAQKGERQFASKGCNACHGVKPGEHKQGPNLVGKFGTQERLSLNNLGPEKTVTIDENYIRNSITDPASQIVEGYQPVMPTYKGIIKDEQIDAIIEYIKTLK